MCVRVAVVALLLSAFVFFTSHLAWYRTVLFLEDGGAFSMNKYYYHIVRYHRYLHLPSGSIAGSTDMLFVGVLNN